MKIFFIFCFPCRISKQFCFWTRNEVSGLSLRQYGFILIKRKMKKELDLEIDSQIILILELLAQRTGRTKDDLTAEALTKLFEEYKEIIFDTEDQIDAQFGPGSKGLEDKN